MVAIGGHSYGAFMTANLLAHAPDLFACGIAQSGAYNRTLTPFGFQVLIGDSTVRTNTDPGYSNICSELAASTRLKSVRYGKFQIST